MINYGGNSQEVRIMKFNEPQTIEKYLQEGPFNGMGMCVFFLIILPLWLLI